VQWGGEKRVSIDITMFWGGKGRIDAGLLWYSREITKKGMRYVVFEQEREIKPENVTQKKGEHSWAQKNGDWGHEKNIGR